MEKEATGDTIKHTISELYENFVMRDLTYIIGGAIILISIVFAYNGNIQSIIIFISDISNNPIFFIFLIMIFYVVGVIQKEGILFICLSDKRLFNDRIIENKKDEKEYGYKDQLLLYYDVNKNYPGIVRGLERITFLKTIGSSIGSASFISVIIILTFHIFREINVLAQINDELYPLTYILYIVSMILIFIVCKIENKFMWNKQRKILKELADQIEAGINSNFKITIAENEE